MSTSHPIIVVKKHAKRPSGVIVSPAHDLSWIAHLHRLWTIPCDQRTMRLIAC